jgi:hypothetical protein
MGKQSTPKGSSSPLGNVRSGVMTDKTQDEHNESAYPPTAALKRTSLEVAFGPTGNIGSSIRSPRRRGRAASGALRGRMPMRGIFPGGCARTASGHAAAAPLKSRPVNTSPSRANLAFQSCSIMASRCNRSPLIVARSMRCTGMLGLIGGRSRPMMMLPDGRVPFAPVR